eukprot:6468230-Prymnesium_polylepis.1
MPASPVVSHVHTSVTESNCSASTERLAAGHSSTRRACSARNRRGAEVETEELWSQWHTADCASSGPSSTRAALALPAFLLVKPAGVKRCSVEHHPQPYWLLTLCLRCHVVVGSWPQWWRGEE